MLRVERVGRRDRDAVLLGGLDDVVIGADLRRRHDDAVDRRVLDDLVQDLDLARRIVDRRFRAEQQDLRADHVAGDRGADIDRVEEAVAGGVGDDGEGQMAVGRMEVLRAVGFLGGVFPRIAADGLIDAAGLRIGAGRAKQKRRGTRRERYKMLSCFTSHKSSIGGRGSSRALRTASGTSVVINHTICHGKTAEFR